MSGSLRALFFFGDLLFLNLSIIASWYLTGNTPGLDARVNNIYLLVFSNLSWLFLVMVSAPYNVNKGWTLSKIVKSQVAFFFIHLLVVASLVLLFKQRYSLFQLGLIYLVFVPVFFLSRLVTFYVRKLSIGDITVTNYVLIGRNELAAEVRKFFLMNPDTGYKFQGYLDFSPDDEFVNRLQAFCEKKDVQEIYCCATNVSKGEFQQLVDFGLDSLIRVKFIVSSVHQQSIRLEQFDQMPGLDLVTIPLDAQRNQILKRGFDLAFSLVFNLLVMSWLVPLLAVIIKLDSPGPVFFGQLRNGELNKPFRCLKFRTMVINEDSDSKQASKDDPRITKIGRWMRRSSLDELPQFINVLVGDMSLIGPRPHPIKLNEAFASRITNIMARHYVKPGITGLAQCMGYRGETQTVADMENRTKLDRYYIENWSFWLDMKIIFLTIVSLIRGSDKAF